MTHLVRRDNYFRHSTEFEKGRTIGKKLEFLQEKSQERPIEGLQG
jgi:hypothetical protein